MLLLMILSISGLIFSAVVHFSMIFNIYNPPRKLIVLIYIGHIAVIYPALIISKKIRDKANIKDFKKAIVNACPNWMSVMTGVFIAYTLAGLIFFAFKRHLSGTVVTNEDMIVDNSFRGFSGHWMALYSLAFTILYSCRNLKNDEEAILEVTSSFDEEEKNKFIRFNCTCGQKIKVEKENAGKIGKCPECQRQLHVPGA